MIPTLNSEKRTFIPIVPTLNSDKPVLQTNEDEHKKARKRSRPTRQGPRGKARAEVLTI
jgi:hypothetical protein